MSNQHEIRADSAYARVLRTGRLASRPYLYCGGGFRSALSADNLQKMGYTNVGSVDGGWRSLKDLMPTE